MENQTGGIMSSNSIPMPDALSGTRAEGRTWLETLHEWVITVDHKKLGLMYIGTALFFLVLGGIEATIMRIQLAVPHAHFVSPQVFNRMFTMHGTTMIFFVAMTILFGFGIYLIPLMIGARDMAFPRLNAWGYWMTAFGGLLLYFSFVGGDGLYGAGTAPDVGWWAYAPLTARAFSKGHSTDYWTIALLVSGFGTLATGVNVVATVVSMRCRGMTLGRMPLLPWLYLVMGGLLLFTITPLTAAQVMLMIDRYLGGHFFDTQAGGSAVIWMHFFWIFGHPEVYVLIIPAFAFMSEIVPVFSRKPIFGYPIMVAATVAIGFISMSVWAHHMFTVGMPSWGNAFFVLSTAAIAVPTGIKIFNWLGTMWGGKIRYATPMLFCIGFLFQFLIAGLTGIMLGSAPAAWQLSGSYFVVAHFHYVIVGGILFALFAAFYYWFPKMTGRLLNEKLGKWHFWLFVIGFHLTFDFMHIPGLLGMPRRIYTYEPGRGWEVLNLIVTVGTFFQAAAILCFVCNLVWSYFQGRRANNDPWDAWTLEWTTSSPPPDYNFAVLPEVRSRRPLWDIKHPEDPDWKYE
jgi:cytochrome c oxidase subunit 1